MQTNARTPEDLTEALIDSASEAFDRARRHAVARLREAGLSEDLAVLSLLASLTEAAERVAPVARTVRQQPVGGAGAPAGNVFPFRCDLR